MDIVKSVIETIGISEGSITSTGLFFGLTEEIEIPGEWKNSDEIKFIPSNDDEKKIRGIEVIIIDLNEQKIEDAYHKVRRILNYIGRNLGRYIDHSRPEEFVLKDGKSTRTVSCTPDVIIVEKFDFNLNDSKIQALINDDDPILNQQISDLMNGIKAYDDRNYGDAIRNFWIAIENETLSLNKNYKHLRNGLSHSKINHDAVKLSLENDFNLRLKPIIDSKETKQGFYIDRNDPVNRNILKKEATILRDIAIPIIDKKMP